jgi:hypothetical protein
MRIHILALNGVFDTGLAAVLDAFDTANALAKMGGVSSLPFQMKVVGLRTTVTTAQGLSVPVTCNYTMPSKSSSSAFSQTNPVSLE